MFQDAREYTKWVQHLSPEMRGRITTKLYRLREHGVGLRMPLVRRLDADLYELRVDKYRLYFTIAHGNELHVLAYGDKGTQQRDIERARGRLR